MSRQPREKGRAGSYGIAAFLTFLGSAAGLVGWSRFAVNRRMDLPPALPGRLETLATERAGAIALYGSREQEGVPLLLIHSINAAANAYEVRPLYKHYRDSRPAYALDLPGFGFSERSRRRYTPRLMVEAIHAAVAEIRGRHRGSAIDAMALSLSCSYLARAAVERPDDYRSLGLISPTGFDARLSGEGPPDGHRGRDALRNLLDRPPFGRPLFDAWPRGRACASSCRRRSARRTSTKACSPTTMPRRTSPAPSMPPIASSPATCFRRISTRLYEELRLPVWMVHGRRGDFVDYRLAPRVAGRPNWRVFSLPTGAFPHFERLDDVTADYDAFLESLSPVTPRPQA